MSLIRLTQDITYWTSAGSDSNGGLSYNSPVTVKGKWVKKDGLVTNEQGDNQKTEFIIYSKTLIPKRSMVVLGVDTSATPSNGARMIESNIDNPSITKVYWHAA